MARANPRRGGAASALLVAGFSVVLAGAVIAETAGAALIDVDARLATLVSGGSASSLQRLAHEQAQNAVSSEEIAAARRTAVRSLKASPLSVTSVRALADVEQLRGEGARSDALLRLAGARNVRDPAVQMALFDKAVRARQGEAAIVHADLLLRRQPSNASEILQAVLGLTDDPATANAFMARLRRGPVWRPELLLYLDQQGDPAGLLTRIASETAHSAHPLSPTENATVAKALLRQGRIRDAYQLWAVSVGGSPLLADGDFDQPLKPAPFGWQLHQGDGFTASVEQGGGGKGRALFTEFAVGHASQLGEQLLVLAPGTYRLAGRSMVEKLPESGVFRWSIRCDTRPLGEVRDETQHDWRGFALEFTVPADCTAQTLAIDGFGGVGYQPANAWFDDLRIEKLS